MASTFENVDFTIVKNPALGDLYDLLRHYGGFGDINDELKAFRSSYASQEQAFEQSLTQEQRSLYNDLYEAQGEELGIHTKQAFIYGYKVALRLAQSE